MIDMAREERGIRRGIIGALAVVLAGFAGAIALLPRLVTLPGELAARLALAALCAGVVALVLLVAVLMVSTGRRSSPEDIAGAAAGPPSPRLARKVAFLQNTLEQTVIAAIAMPAYAAVFAGDWLAVVPVAAAFFVLGRVLFDRGHPGGAGARAFGMALTMLPGALLLLAALGGAIWRGLA